MTMTQLPTMSMIPVMKPLLGPEEAQAAADAVLSGWVAQGPRVAEFERRFAAAVGAPHGAAVSSCTTALHLGLVLAGVGPGDDVVVPSLSFVATTNAVRHAGANPVFADVEAATGNLTAQTVEAAITPRTRLVIVVHQGGMPADVDAIAEVCEPFGVRILEDAACAIGSTYRGRPVGAGAELAAWSFHPRKLLTTGEGGMLTLADGDLAVRARRLREHGMSMSAADREAAGGPVIEQYLEVGFNYRMTDIQAAVGLVQLDRLAAVVARRRELAARYREQLAGVAGISLPEDPVHGTTNHQSFVVRLHTPGIRNQVMAELAAEGVSARRGIMAAHLEPAWARHPRTDLPVTEELSANSLILPLYHDLGEADQLRVSGALTRAVGQLSA
jgi:dTDP-4-amino-4,6-dideoxygalactose transaminase